jgi:hypothetical protein
MHAIAREVLKAVFFLQLSNPVANNTRKKEIEAESSAADCIAVVH